MPSLVEQINSLNEDRLKAAADIQTLADKAEHPHSTKEEAAEWRESWDKVNADYDSIQVKQNGLVAEKKEQDAIKDRLSMVQDDLNQPAAPLIGRDGADSLHGPNNDPASQHALALAGWLLNGSDTGIVTDEHRTAAQQSKVNLNSNQFRFDLSNTETFNSMQEPYAEGYRNRRARNDLKVGQVSAGGALVGSTLLTNLEMAMLDYSGIMQVAEIIRTSNGEPFNWPTVDDTSNTGRLIGEAEAATSTDEPTWGTNSWGAHIFTSNELKVSIALLEDSVLNLPVILGKLLGQRLGRIQNTKFTLGTGGGNEPRGLSVSATAGVTAASSTAVIWDEIIDLEYSVDPSRRDGPKVGYMLNDAIVQILRKLKTGVGEYLWQSGANAGTPDSLNNRPFWVNQDMPSTITSGADFMLFGQLDQYKVRQVNQIVIKRLKERHIENYEEAFIAFVRGDGNLLDAGDGPVRKLTAA